MNFELQANVEAPHRFTISTAVFQKPSHPFKKITKSTEDSVTYSNITRYGINTIERHNLTEALTVELFEQTP